MLALVGQDPFFNQKKKLVEKTLPAKTRFIVKNYCIWIRPFLEAWSEFVPSYFFAYFLADWSLLPNFFAYVAPSMIFEGCLDAKPDRCRTSGVRYQLCHPSLHLETHTSTLPPIPSLRHPYLYFTTHPAYIHVLFHSDRIRNPESIAALPPFGPPEGHKLFAQISSQWESQKNQFAFISFGKIQFYLPAFETSRSCRIASGCPDFGWLIVMICADIAMEAVLGTDMIHIEIWVSAAFRS